MSQIAPPARAKELSLILLYFGVGIPVYCGYEGWTFTEALYFEVVTVTTVGYGGLHPTSTHSKLFTIVYAMVGLGYIAFLIRDVAKGIRTRLAKTARQRHTSAAVDDVQKKRRECIITGCYAILLISFNIAVGTAVTMCTEGWYFIDALYFSFISALTIGYGDVRPDNHATEVFAIIYLLVSTVTVAGAITKVASLGLELEQAKQHASIQARVLNTSWIYEMDSDGNGRVDKAEFIISILSQLGHITKEDVDPWLRRFDELDRNKSGTLEVADIQRIVHAGSAVSLQAEGSTGHLSLPLTSAS